MLKTKLNNEYTTTGTCSKKITFDIVENCIYNVKYDGGCQGNLSAISKLINGKDVKELKTEFSNHLCGKRPTSCIKQLVDAIVEFEENYEA